MKTKIQKWGNSQGIRIPRVILDDVHWGIGEELAITIKNEKIILSHAESPKTIEELFSDYDENFTSEEINWGGPIGREIF